MYKLFFKLLFIIICVFSSFSVYAYDFVNDANSDSIYASRERIYGLKSLYEYLVDDEDEDEIEYEEVSSSNSYWWPIGSDETTKNGDKLFASGDPVDSTITSSFGFRGAVINSSGQTIAGNENHGAIDIATGAGIGVTNIIASKSGTVVYPTSNDRIDCKNMDSSCTGYGNYVIIQHSDGNFTLYAHLDANSITVKAGDVVDQGQVIAKMGTSGNSTGPHLHFEVRIGTNNSSSVVDPLDYVDLDNPRPNESYGSIDFDQLVEYIFTWEGSTPSTDTEYIAVWGDNLINIGHGVTWENTRQFFAKYGITEMHVGDKVSKEIVDQVAVDALKYTIDEIKSDFAANGIDDLKDYQLLALASQVYNGGYTVIKNNKYGYDFISAYLKHNGRYSFDDIYKHESSIWYDSMCRPYAPGTGNQLGLQRRRVSEWRLFTTGEIDYYPLNTFDPSKYAWPE